MESASMYNSTEHLGNTTAFRMANCAEARCRKPGHGDPLNLTLKNLGSNPQSWGATESCGATESLNLQCVFTKITLAEEERNRSEQGQTGGNEGYGTSSGWGSSRSLG